MWIRGGFLCFLLSLLIAASVCHGGEYETVEVVGIGECADCVQNKIKTSQAFSGLRVTIDCKAKNGDFKTKGVGELKEDGSFKVTLPQEIILEDGKLKEECYAQLHSASAAPCPAHNGLESSKIILKSKTNGKHTFGLSGNLKFSPATCISAYLWPYYHKYPPLPKVPYYKYPPIHKSYPPYKHYDHYYYPLPPIYKKPLPPPVPIYKKPLPPPLPPVYSYTHPPIPIYKPLPPKVPYYKYPPIHKSYPPYKHDDHHYYPLPPIYKKPLPPPVPIYKKPPVYTHPPIPIYKPLPPFYKKPSPPLPKLPPKYLQHPKFGKYPPLAPYHP